jgi:NAD-dependent deacetylase
MDTFYQWIKECKRIVFFGGAGVSTESGIPDFRSAKGIYQTTPEEMVSHHYFMEHPKEFYAFYKDKMVYPNAKPNITHEVLAKLEQQGKLSCIITQNIDGLHQKAGSQKVIELHGSVLRNYCVKCHRFYDVDKVLDSEIPYCECGGMIKPDVVLYEENLKKEDIDHALYEIEHADMLIVAGTSLSVYPAAGMIRYFRGNRLVLLNKSATSADEHATLCIRDSIGQVLKQIEIR